MAIENQIFIGTVTFGDFLLFIFFIIFTFIFGTLMNALIIKFLKGKTDRVIYKSLSKIVMYSIYLLGIYYAFNHIIELNVSATLAALGILGIVLVAPSLPLLQNIIAGIVLAFERPFKEGDVIEIDGTLCRVTDTMLRKTKLRAFDGKILIVPNVSFLTQKVVVNYSEGEFIKVEIPITIAHQKDKEKAEEILKKICYNNPNILPNVPQKNLTAIARFLEKPRAFFRVKANLDELKPVVVITSASKDAIELQVWFWIWNILMRRRTMSSFYDAVIKEFKKNKIKLG